MAKIFESFATTIELEGCTYEQWRSQDFSKGGELKLWKQKSLKD